MKRKKLIRAALLAFACLLIFVIGLWLFFPLQAMAEYAVSRVQLSAANNGLYLTYGKLETMGLFVPRVRLIDVKMDYAIGQIATSSMEVKIHPFASVFSRGLDGTISFGSGEITLFPNSRGEWNSGKLNLSVNDSRLVLSDVSLTGDVSMRGDLDFSIAERRFERNNLAIGLPAAFDPILKNLGGQIPIEQKSPGTWGIRQ